jgi:hypothetical protein
MKLRLHIIILFSLFNATLFAQVPSWSCVRSYSSAVNEYGRATFTDQNGRTYFIGSFFGPTLTIGTSTLVNTNPGTADFFIGSLFDCGGDFWVSSFGTAGNDECIAITKDNVTQDLYVTGYFTSSTLAVGPYVLTNNGNEDIFVFKFDALGTIQWAKSFGGPGSDKPKSLCMSSNGAVNIVGDFSSTFSAGSNTLANAGDLDIFWIQLNVLGNLNLARSYGSADRDVANCVSLLTNSAIAIGGAYRSNTLALGVNTITNSNPGTFDGFMTEISTSMIESWTYSFGNAGDEEVTDISDVNQNYFLVLANYSSPNLVLGSFSVTNASPGTSDIVFMTFDYSHIMNTAKSYGGNGDDKAVSFSDVGLMCGTFASSNLIMDNFSAVNPTPGTTDVFITLFDGVSSFLSGLTVSSPGDDRCYFVQDKIWGNNVYLAGYFSADTAKFNGIPSTKIKNGGGTDAFTAKYYFSNVGMSETDPDDKWSIYPSPASETIFLRTENKISKYKILDYSGREIANGVISEISGQTISIDLSSFDNGLYFLMIEGNEHRQAKQFVIQR